MNSVLWFRSRSARARSTCSGYWSSGRASNRAIGLLRQARASNPRLFYVHLHLALGLKGDLDEARSALAEGIKLKPEVNSLAGLRSWRSWGNPRYWELCEKTLHAGLSRAGMPDA